MRKMLFLFLFGFGFASIAQPATEVYLFSLKNKKGRLTVSNGKNISKNTGYDNQPAFLPDSQSLLFTSQQGDQNDVIRYYIATGRKEVLITSAGSEYSPTPIPGQDAFSSIIQEKSGLQLLWKYNIDGKKRDLVVPDLVIGYHAWINENELVAFVLGEPNTMQLITVGGKARIVAENIGRSLHLIPGQNKISYLDKSGEAWIIKAMDPVSEETSKLIPAFEGSEDYTWTPDGQIIMGNGSKLYQWKSDSEWIEFADLSSINLTGITRLDVSPDGQKLVVVVSE